MTQTEFFTEPYGFVAIQAAILLGLMTTSYLHIVAYGRTPIRQQAQKEKEKEKYLRLSQSSTNSPASARPKLSQSDPGSRSKSTQSSAWADEFDVKKSVAITLAVTPGAAAMNTAAEPDKLVSIPITPSKTTTSSTSEINAARKESTAGPESPSLTRVPTVELAGGRRMTTTLERQLTPSGGISPTNLSSSLDSAAEKPRLSANNSNQVKPPLSPMSSGIKQTLEADVGEPRTSLHLPPSSPSSFFSMSTLESAADRPRNSFNQKPLQPINPNPFISMKTLESAVDEPQPKVPRLVTLESAPPGLPPLPVVPGLSKPITQRITITDSQVAQSEAKEDRPPPMLRQSSFEATRKEQNVAPTLVEERGPWQVR